MQCSLIEFDVKPECIDAWLTTFTEFQARVYDEEPACLLFQLARDPEAPGHFTVLEIHETREALKLHMELVPKIFPINEEQLASPPGSEIPHVIFPLVATPIQRVRDLDSASVAIINSSTVQAAAPSSGPWPLLTSNLHITARTRSPSLW